MIKDLYLKAISSTPIESSWWTRNPDWVAMPTINAGDNTFAAIAAVYEDDDLNYYKITGNSSIDWGDGTLTGSEHQFIYSTITSDVLIDESGRNYKTVLVTGGSGAYLSFKDAHSNGCRSYDWLELLIDSPSQITLSISTPNESIMPVCQKIEFLSAMPSMNFSNSRLSYMSSLKVLKGLDLSSSTAGGSEFYNSGDFRGDDDGTPINLDFSSCGNISQLMAYSSISLIGDLVIPNCVSVELGFYLSNLRGKLKLISSALLASINALASGTKVSSIEVTDASGLLNTSSFAPFRTLESCILQGITIGFDVSYQKMSATALNAMFTALGTASGTQTIYIQGNMGASTCDTSIATGKGFTVIV